MGKLYAAAGITVLVVGAIWMLILLIRRIACKTPKSENESASTSELSHLWVHVRWGLGIGWTLSVIPLAVSAVTVLIRMVPLDHATAMEEVSGAFLPYAVYYGYNIVGPMMVFGLAVSISVLLIRTIVTARTAHGVEG